MRDPATAIDAPRANLDKLRAPRTHRRRTFATGCLALAAFGLVAGQLIRHGLVAEPSVTLAAAKPLARGWARPDIVDRHGRLIAADIATPSLFADPALLVDVDEAVEFLRPIFPDLNWRELRDRLDNRKRRFVWIKRGVSEDLARRITEFGLPGLAFRQELRRTYPAGPATAHVLGYVDVDNHGKAGVETFVQDVIGVDATDGAVRSKRAPVRLTIDLGIQHVLRSELAAAQKRYDAKAAAGILMDVNTGAVIASASLPDFDPLDLQQALEAKRLDRNLNGRYELGSVFKAITLAGALEHGVTTPHTLTDTREPIAIGKYTITEPASSRGALNVEEIFIRSSNVGTARIALELGRERLKRFYTTLGLTDSMSSEVGPLATPRLPKRWSDIHTVTMSYGHGIAVAPLQFAAAVAPLINGGNRVYPRFVEIAKPPATAQILSKETSAEMRRLFRRNVTSRHGTGRRAAVPGYHVGGKTGTADQPKNAEYADGRVISSFIGAFPMGKPQYLSFVMLFEPKKNADAGNKVSAKYTAAPLTARFIKRAAPMLGLAPNYDEGDGS